MHQTQYDCCVIGGGMIGAAIALGLAKQSYKVALIEKQALAPFDANQAPDIRLSALNIHSASLLTSLGAWQHVQKMRFRPYNTLSVWDAEKANLDFLSAIFSSKGSKRARTQFTAKEVNQALLGYFVENRLIQLALFDEIKANYLHLIDCIHQQQINNIDVEKGIVALNNNQNIKASLIIGADGANSKVREAAGIATSGWQYSQQANAILIKTRTKVPDETWQAFHASGPRALLPMYDNYACLVWYDSAVRSEQIKQASKTELTQEIKINFPDLTQEFDVIKVAGFGLTRMHAHSYGKGRAVIAGDAAHSINPLAGQGVNLGFQDVSVLLDIIQQHGLDDSNRIILNYEQKRKMPNLLMMSAMDILYKSFSTSSLPIAVVRNFGLALANNAGPLKHNALKYAMGIQTQSK
jgi:2-octaprenyl-3-methyl-6-methoxy-1,4-benzoquinol hydroxylase